MAQRHRFAPTVAMQLAYPRMCAIFLLSMLRLMLSMPDGEKST